MRSSDLSSALHIAKFLMQEFAKELGNCAPKATHQSLKRLFERFQFLTYTVIYFCHFFSFCSDADKGLSLSEQRRKPSHVFIKEGSCSPSETQGAFLWKHDQEMINNTAAINGAAWCCLCLKVVPFPLLLAGESEEKLKLLFVSKTNLVVVDYGRWIVSTVITVQVGNAALRLVRCFPQFYQCKSRLSLY